MSFKAELSYDDLWIVREALSKRIETFREHIEYMKTCAEEMAGGATVPLLGGGEQGQRVVREVIENFEAQIRKHKWLIEVPFNPDGDEEEEA